MSGRSERLSEALLKRNLKPMDAPIRDVSPINLRFKRKKHGKTEAVDIGYRLKDIYSFCSKWYREGETRKSDGLFYFRDGIAAFKQRTTGSH